MELLHRIYLPEGKSIDYFRNRDLATALSEEIKSQEGITHLIRLMKKVKPSPLLSLKLPEQTPVVEPQVEPASGSKEAIFKRLQGLTPDQQLLTADEVRIIMGGMSVSTFYELRK